MSIGFFGLLTIALVVLKLAGVLTVSWFWVLSPLLVSFLIFMAALVALVFLETKERKRF